jgi:hypothetical protein
MRANDSHSGESRSGSCRQIDEMDDPRKGTVVESPAVYIALTDAADFADPSMLEPASD